MLHDSLVMALSASLPPALGFRSDGELNVVCPHRHAHRDVCSGCLATRPEVVEVRGAYLWVPDESERDALRALLDEAGGT